MAVTAFSLGCGSKSTARDYTPRGRPPRLSSHSYSSTLLYIAGSFGTEGFYLNGGKTSSTLPLPMFTYFDPNGKLGYAVGSTGFNYMFPKQQVYRFYTPPMHLDWKAIATDVGCASGLVFSPKATKAFVLIGPCETPILSIPQVFTPQINVISTKTNVVLSHFDSPVASLSDAFMSPDGKAIWSDGVEFSTISGTVIGRVLCPDSPHIDGEVGISPSGGEIFISCPFAGAYTVIDVFNTRTFSLVRKLIPSGFSAKASYLIDRGNDVALVGTNSKNGKPELVIISSRSGRIRSSVIFKASVFDTSCQKPGSSLIALVGNTAPPDQFQHTGQVTSLIVNATNPSKPLLEVLPLTLAERIGNCALS